MPTGEKTKTNKASDVTSVSGYRALIGKTIEVVAPSGAMFKIKRLSPMDYIQEGLADIPNEFFKFMAKLTAGNFEEANEEKNKKNLEIFQKFLNTTVLKGIIHPPITMIYSEEMKETHLLWQEVQPDDQKFLIDVITGRVKIDG